MHSDAVRQFGSWLVVLAACSAAGVALSLFVGRTLVISQSRIYGLVTRRDDPMGYWSGIVTLSLIAIVCAAMGAWFWLAG